jgi:hypothetical protein
VCLYQVLGLERLSHIEDTKLVAGHVAVLFEVRFIFDLNRPAECSLRIAQE